MQTLTRFLLTFDVETYMLTPSFDSTPVIDRGNDGHRGKKVVVKKLTDKELDDEIQF